MSTENIYLLLSQLDKQRNSDLQSSTPHKATKPVPLLHIHPPSRRSSVSEILKRSVAYFDAMLDTMELIQSELTAMRYEVTSMRAPHAEALSPISVIPSEVLRIIFSFTVEIYEDDQAIKLAQVCRLWRDVATHQQTLWAIITVPMQPRRLPLYVNNSRDRDVHLIVQEKLSSINNAKLLQKRINEITIGYGASGSPDTLRTLFDNDDGFPALEVLWLFNKDADLGEYVHRQPVDLSDIPMPFLIELYLHHCPLVILDPQSVSLYLLSLEFDIIDLEELRELLTSCPQLVILKIRMITFLDMADTVAAAPVIMGDLESMLFECMDHNDVASILSSLEAQNLAELRLVDIVTHPHADLLNPLSRELGVVVSRLFIKPSLRKLTAH